MIMHKSISNSYFFQNEYSEKFLFNIFNDIFDYLKIIEEQSIKSNKRFYSLKCIKYHYKNYVHKINKINYCIDVKEELTGVILLYFLKYYNFPGRNIIEDFVNDIDCKLKYDHDQEDFTIFTYKKSYKNTRERWLNDKRWSRYSFTFRNLLETIFFCQMPDTLIYDDNKKLFFGQREILYISPIIGSGVLYMNNLPFEYFNEDSEEYNAAKIMEKIQTKIVRIQDIIL